MKASGNGSVAQCADNLLRLFRGEVPYERTKGLDPSLIDRPIGDVEAEVQQDAEWLLETYEPRATVNGISLQGADTSAGSFAVVANIAEER